MKTIIRKHQLLFIFLLLYIGAGLALLIIYEKGELELIINRKHHPVLDQLFFYITYLGDGLALVPFMVLLLFRRIYDGLLVALSFVLSTIIVQLLKRMFFAHYPRPSKFFEKYTDIHFVEGLKLHSYYSFPSGHSSGAFAVFFMLGLLVKDKAIAILFFFLALLASFSRIYLMQHFFMDTFAGATIGAIVSIVLYYFIDQNSSLPQNEIMNRPLMKVFEKSAKV